MDPVRAASNSLGKMLVQNMVHPTMLAAILFIVAPVLAQRTIPEPLFVAEYSVDNPIQMNMTDTKDVQVELRFDPLVVQRLKFDSLRIQFAAITLSPQFDILELQGGTVEVSRQMLGNRNSITTKLRLITSYIGHAIVKPIKVELNSANSIGVWDIDIPGGYNELHVTVYQYEGIWGTVFIVSVTIFIIISHINLGAQLDRENTIKMLKKPNTVILGLIITVLIMPIVSWAIGLWLLGDQLLYRVGSFIFACGPAASASSLWTVMLDADKELSVGLQVASTVGALVSMPVLMYLMESSMNLSKHKHVVKVPYTRLIQTLLVLLVALYVGWRYVGSHERAQKISRKIFRPLTFFVLIFIIVFSSIVYWHIYLMFDWSITLTSFLISSLTYIICGLLGYLIDCNIDQAITISICSTYKNSGIAFAVLLLAFGPPDTYIAYIPCLTQIVATSLTLYIIYLIISIMRCIKRRNQPDAIAATNPDATEAQQSKDEKPTEANEDEFIALNVTDVIMDNEPRKSIDDKAQVEATVTKQTA